MFLALGIMQYVDSLRGSASKETKLADVAKQLSKPDDNAILIVGVFESQQDKAFKIYEEASELLFITVTIFQVSM